jgi:hypothetical protein
MKHTVFLVFFGLFLTNNIYAQSEYEETISIPNYDSENSEMMLIDDNDDWNQINNPSIRYFYILPGDYTDAGTSGRVFITISGTDTHKRYISLYNGNDEHPAKLDTDMLAKVRLVFDAAENWVVDRMAYWDFNYSDWILDFVAAKNIIINRQLIRDTNSSVVWLRDQTENICIQNCRFERTYFTLITDMAAIGLSGNPNTTIKNTKIINNEIVNYNDPVQTIRNPVDSPNINHEGTIIDFNHFYVSELYRTDCNGNQQSDGDCIYGENAIDLKAGSTNPDNPIIITNNLMWGYRTADQTGSNMASNGTAITIHYNVENVIIKKILSLIVITELL